ncbi:hypothetical protein GGR50DRAFT_695405 [Xylaria sp. CBS 124048]|nr:hypothetical protein GGR50DRAFT_695405 [Xylaria sp. CBS 124048]
MAEISFHKNYVIVKANAAVSFLDFGFPGGDKVLNDHTTTAPVSGSSQRVRVHYHDENPPPESFEATKEYKFPADAHVTVTGGGPNDNVVEAVDARGNRAVWSLVGRK